MDEISSMERIDDAGTHDEENPSTDTSASTATGHEGHTHDSGRITEGGRHERSSRSSSVTGAHNYSSSIPITLRWSRLRKVVQVQENKSGLIRSSIAGKSSITNNDDVEHGNGSSGPVTKTILNEVSGYAKPGQVIALIGPSGSGKTSLLNAISGRTSFDSGTISVNGIPIGGGSTSDASSAFTTSQVVQHKQQQQALSSPATSASSLMKRFVSKVAYVKQEDIFFVHLTVRDQLAYTAFLRLPQELPRAVKLEEVDRIIRLLRLDKVQNSQIKFLSGGEKKRVNIGTELLTNPSVLLLDEPTSGLDSTNAVALVKMLQSLARIQQKTVLMSIHQPSSAMFMSFDSLLMLAAGNVVYFGSPKRSISYLKDRDLACPEGYNAADHWMDLLVSDSTLEEEDELAASTHYFRAPQPAETNGDNGLRNRKSSSQFRREKRIENRQCTRGQLIDAWDSNAFNEEVETAIQEDLKQAKNQNNKNGGLTSVDSKKYQTSWLVQYRVLVHRAMKNSRTAIFTPLNVIKSTVIGIVAGLLWFQMDYTEKTVHDRTSYVFFTMTFWVFDAMFNALLAFPTERKVILKERASSSYHLSAYFMAKTTSEAPTRLCLPVIYMTISFWLAGISSRFDLYVLSTMISLQSVLAGESFGLFVGASIDRIDRAMTTATVVILSMMLIGGFYVQNVPGFVAWIRYFSPFKYAFDASRELIFDRDVPCDGSGELQDLCGVDGFEEGKSVSPEELLRFLNVQGGIGFNVGMLFVVAFVPRYLAFLALKFRKGGER